MKYPEKEKLNSIPEEHAVGKMLLHDITRIIPDIFKGPYFKKGHIITASDVEILLDLGKRHVYVTGFENEVHENEAAERIANAATGAHISLTQPEEGKVEFVAETNGLLKVNINGLNELNAIQDVIFATLHSFREVEKGTSIAGTRVVPLAIPARQIEEAKTVCRRYFPEIILMVPGYAQDQDPKPCRKTAERSHVLFQGGRISIDHVSGHGHKIRGKIVTLFHHLFQPVFFKQKTDVEIRELDNGKTVQPPVHMVQLNFNGTDLRYPDRLPGSPNT
jgi:hypothetical protein